MALLKRSLYFKLFFFTIAITACVICLTPKFYESGVNFLQVVPQQASSDFKNNCALRERQAQIWNNKALISTVRQQVEAVRIPTTGLIRSSVKKLMFSDGPTSVNVLNGTVASNKSESSSRNLVEYTFTVLSALPESLVQTKDLEGFPKDSRTIYLTLRGRLGNHLFQIASLYAFALRTKRKPTVFTRKSYFNKLVNLFPNIGREISFVIENDVESGVPSLSVPIWLQRNLSTTDFKDSLFGLYVEAHASCMDNGFSRRILSSQAQHLRLCCFLASWKYFLPSHEREIWALFQVSDYYKSYSASRIKYLLAEKLGRSSLTHYKVVGVHVRRGDLVKYPSLKEEGRMVADKSYYEKAMDYFRKKYGHVIFIVTGNVDQWTYHNLNMTDTIITSEKDPRKDFVLLTSCDDVIISVGTFGWWAALLARGEVIYFGDYSEKDSLMSTTICDTDYFLPKWKQY